MVGWLFANNYNLWKTRSSYCNENLLHSWIRYSWCVVQIFSSLGCPTNNIADLISQLLLPYLHNCLATNNPGLPSVTTPPFCFVILVIFSLLFFLPGIPHLTIIYPDCVFWLLRVSLCLPLGHGTACAVAAWLWRAGGHSAKPNDWEALDHFLFKFCSGD